jgi:hypothetical protein
MFPFLSYSFPMNFVPPPPPQIPLHYFMPPTLPPPPPPPGLPMGTFFSLSLKKKFQWSYSTLFLDKYFGQLLWAWYYAGYCAGQYETMRKFNKK